MISLDSIKSDLHSIEIKDASGQALAIDGSGFLTSNINGTVTVSASDLDVRDLVFATDKVDASGSEVSLDAATLAALETITVTAADLDIRDLAFATDSVTAHQGGAWSFAVDNMSSWKSSSATATNTASELAGTPLASRSKMIVQNLGNQDVYIGPDNSVTTANGIYLPKGSSFDYPFDATANIFVITSSGTSDIRVLEAAA